MYILLILLRLRIYEASCMQFIRPKLNRIWISNAITVWTTLRDMHRVDAKAGNIPGLVIMMQIFDGGSRYQQYRKIASHQPLRIL